MKKYIKPMLIICMLVFGFILYKYFLKGITAQSIRDYVLSFGYVAPLVYIVIWIVLPTIFFPVPILALAGGLSFGLIDGSIYTIIGAMLNSLFMFIIAKVLARDLINSYLEKKLPRKWWDKFENADSKKGFVIVLICRLIPIMPYNVINYVSGLTNISIKNYLLATFTGILPGTVVFLNVGDKILNIGSMEFYISIILVVLLTVVSILLGRLVAKQNN